MCQIALAILVRRRGRMLPSRNFDTAFLEIESSDNMRCNLNAFFFFLRAVYPMWVEVIKQLFDCDYIDSI